MAINTEKRQRKLWDWIKYQGYRLTYGALFNYVIYISTSGFRRKLNILDSEETVQEINGRCCSIARFGDGELHMIGHYLKGQKESDWKIDTFQNYTPKLAQRLQEVLLSDSEECMICIPYLFKDFSQFHGYERFHFKREYFQCKDVLKVLQQNRKSFHFGDSCFTRFWHNRSDIKDYDSYIRLLKQIWDRKDVTFIEGETSRLGIGNDLFDNARSIQRILCPPVNAFSRYDEILDTVKSLPKDRLYLLALGHTATVLAYDMSKMGFRAMDIGHIDIEYEWMKMGAKEKVAVPGKCVYEVPDGRAPEDSDDTRYRSQIICHIR